MMIADGARLLVLLQPKPVLASRLMPSWNRPNWRRIKSCGQKIYIMAEHEHHFVANAPLHPLFVQASTFTLSKESL